MRQFIGTGRGVKTVTDLLLSVSPPRIQAAATTLANAEETLPDNGERSQLAYASALAEWSDAGGYQAEVLWDVCCVEAFGIPSPEPSEACSWQPEYFPLRVPVDMIRDHFLAGATAATSAGATTTRRSR